MAAVVLNSHRPTSSRVLFSPPGQAQGPEGQFLGYGVAHAAERWRGPSEYVATLLSGRDEPPPMNWVLTAAGLLATAGGGLTICGSVSGAEQVLFPLAAAAGLAAYGLFCRWLARCGRRSGFLWTLERLRRSIAYEGDPGPRVK